MVDGGGGVLGGGVLGGGVLVDGVLVDGVLVADGVVVVDEAAPGVALVDGVPVIVGAPLTVELGGGVVGSPGLVRFTPGVLAPPTVLDGVPRFDSDPVIPVPVPVEVPGCGFDSVAPGLVVVDDGVDDGDGLPADGETCEIVGLRSLGTPGFDELTTGAVGLGRTRSPSGIPSRSARSPDGRGPASTNSAAAASAAR